MEWKIERGGRAWQGEEAFSRHELVPGKVELIRGKLFWSEEDRLTMLALLLENVGIDKALSLGDPNVWKDAIEHRL